MMDMVELMDCCKKCDLESNSNTDVWCNHLAQIKDRFFHTYPFQTYDLYFTIFSGFCTIPCFTNCFLSVLAQFLTVFTNDFTQFLSVLSMTACFVAPAQLPSILFILVHYCSFLFFLVLPCSFLFFLVPSCSSLLILVPYNPKPYHTISNTCSQALMSLRTLPIGPVQW